jgi:hypothetical protein
MIQARPPGTISGALPCVRISKDESRRSFVEAAPGWWAQNDVRRSLAVESAKIVGPHFFGSLKRAPVLPGRVE